MRKILICLAAATLLALGVFAEGGQAALAMDPAEPYSKAASVAADINVGDTGEALEESPDCPFQAEGTGAPSAIGYTDSEINMIANVVDGEIGGICGSVTLTYADGSQIQTDASALRMIHARIVDNQVRSSLFPSSVQSCVGQCWSWSYTGTEWRDSARWKSCRAAVVDALAGDIYVPSNVFAATCDAGFASYAGWHLWARVDWDTGWFSGVFYYYSYGG